MQRVVLEFYNNSPKNKMLYPILTIWTAYWISCNRMYFGHFVPCRLVQRYFLCWFTITVWAPHYQLDPKKQIGETDTVNLDCRDRAQRRKPLRWRIWSYARSDSYFAFANLNNIYIIFCWSPRLAWSHWFSWCYIKVFKKIRKDMERSISRS